jgi:hypothetical protein
VAEARLAPNGMTDREIADLDAVFGRRRIEGGEGVGIFFANSTVLNGTYRLTMPIFKIKEERYR